MNAPDENSMIASLLEDAARSAAAANEKLAEALAITEQARRDAAFNADRQWFKARPAAASAPASPRRKRSTTCTVAAHGRRGGCLPRAASFTPSSSMSRAPGSKRSTLSCRRRGGSRGRTSSDVAQPAEGDR